MGQVKKEGMVDSRLGGSFPTPKAKPHNFISIIMVIYVQGVLLR